MAEFTVPIIELKKVGKHPNADLLSISQVMGHPVIFKTEEFKSGDRAIYLPEEAVLPDKPIYAWIWKNIENPSKSKRTVWAKKLRGIFSCGILISIPEEYKDLPTGIDLRERLGIEKYEPPEVASTGGDNEKQQSWFPKYTEIENLRKYSDIIQLGEEVIITEKIHGSNSRYAYVDDKLWIGSHNNVKRLDATSVWNNLAKKLDLENILKRFPGLVIYGEAYGNTQKGFTYDTAEASALRLFDIYDLKAGKYLDSKDFFDIAFQMNLPTVPVLYIGSWQGIEAHKPLAEGKTTLGAKHMREGYVVKPTTEQWNNEIGRVILKYVGEQYLLQKGR